MHLQYNSCTDFIFISTQLKRINMNNLLIDYLKDWKKCKNSKRVYIFSETLSRDVPLEMRICREEYKVLFQLRPQ